MKRRIDDILFNGYVREPLPMVILALLVGVGFLFLSICATCDLFFASPVSTTMREVAFVEYESDGPIYVLRSSNGDLYDLPIDAVDNTSLMDELVCASREVNVKCVLPENEDAKRYDILSISSFEGKTILSEEIISKAMLNNTYTSIMILWIACGLYIFLITISYYIISNAPRFPRITSCLIRKSFRNF